jgi:hypothetical protein
MWIPSHAPNNQIYWWDPPSVVGDVALEEALKAKHKQSDAVHIFTIPRLCSPTRTRLFHKMSDFVIKLPVGSSHWPEGLHEPLFVGFSLPYIRYYPWSLRGMAVLVEMEQNMRKVLSSGEGYGGDICANFCDSRGGFPACWKVWHEGCYECLGKGKFPMFQVTDGGGNNWHNQQKEEDCLNHGCTGAHVVLPFQCESCWMINLERCLPVPGLDDVYVFVIRQANLDAMAGRAKSMITGHIAMLGREIWNAQLICKTPTVEPRGPLPLGDTVGMGIAVDMLVYSLTAKPRITGQKFIQYATARKVRATYTCLWELSPRGLEEGSSFTQGFGRAILTSCPAQQK